MENLSASAFFTPEETTVTATHSTFPKAAVGGQEMQGEQGADCEM